MSKWASEQVSQQARIADIELLLSIAQSELKIRPLTSRHSTTEYLGGQCHSLGGAAPLTSRRSTPHLEVQQNWVPQRKWCCASKWGVLRLQVRGAVPPSTQLCCALRWGVLFFMSVFTKLGVKKERFKKINGIFFFRELLSRFLPIFIFQVFNPFNDKWLVPDGHWVPKLTLKHGQCFNIYFSQNRN